MNRLQTRSFKIGNVQIGDNCLIGANAVVTKNCNEDGGILVGIPAKIK